MRDIKMFASLAYHLSKGKKGLYHDHVMLFCDGSCNLIAERNNDSVFVTRTYTKETFLARQSLRGLKGILMMTIKREAMRCYFAIW